MSKFNELHEHLRECVDSDNDSFIGITEDGVEFNMYEWAFALSINAKREHDQLIKESKRLREMVNCASSEVKSLSNSIDVLEVWIDNESRCAEWVSIDVIMYRLGKMQARLSKLLSKLDGEK